MYHNNQSAKVPDGHTVHIKYGTAATVGNNNNDDAIYRGQLPVSQALLLVFLPNETKQASGRTRIQSDSCARLLNGCCRQETQPKQARYSEKSQSVEVPCSGTASGSSGQMRTSTVLLRWEENYQLFGRADIKASVCWANESCRVVVLMGGQGKKKQESHSSSQILVGGNQEPGE